MNTPSRQDIIKIKLSKARRTLSEAEKLIEFNFPDAAVNRLYYACFYATTALLFSKDVFTKTHAGVKQMLGLHFVSTGILSLEMGEFYGNIFLSRQGAHYDDFAVADPALVKEYAKLAEQFVSGVQNILNL